MLFVLNKVVVYHVGSDGIGLGVEVGTFPSFRIKLGPRKCFGGKWMTIVVFVGETMRRFHAGVVGGVVVVTSMMVLE